MPLTQQLLILGNGFDLQCGLKSSYKDFFHNTILDTYSAHNGYPMLRDNCRGFWETLLLAYYKKYGNIDYRWCDIENIIKTTLNVVFINDAYDSMSVNYGIWRSAWESVQKTKLQGTLDYRLHVGDDIADPIKKCLFRYCYCFFYDLIGKRTIYIHDEAKQILLNQFLHELYNFEKRFCKYIKDNIANPKKEIELNTTYITNAVNLLAKLTDFSSLYFEGIEDIYERQNEFSKLRFTNILSFNYTSLFDILEIENPCASYCNVHGKLCNKRCKKNCDSSNIIFGIDDIIIQSKSEYAELRVFSKTYRKMLSNGAPANILPPNDIPLVIKFYGHSLSEADYSYFQSIFDYYNIYGNNKVSLIFYYSKGYEQTDAIYRLINSYGKTLSNQSQGKNLIHKLLLENRLTIKEI